MSPEKGTIRIEICIDDNLLSQFCDWKFAGRITGHRPSLQICFIGNSGLQYSREV